jgi:hypothetical protein
LTSAVQDFQFIQVSAVENVLLYRWRNRLANVPAVRDMLQEMRDHYRVHGRASFLVRIPDDSPVQPQEVRDVIQRELHALDSQTICSATVITREGFIGSALRAAVGTMRLLSRVTHPSKTFQRVEDTVRWVRAEHTRHGAPAPGEVALLAALRALETSELASG